MSEIEQVTARCVCGKVTMTAKKVKSKVGACHCSTCRQWGGGPLMTIDCGSEVEISGASNVARYDSSAWAERGFCNHCGSHLFYRLKQNDQYIVPVGLIEEQQQLSFDHQIFIDEKPDYYEFANQTHNMTGAEVFAAYAPAED